MRKILIYDIYLKRSGCLMIMNITLMIIII